MQGSEPDPAFGEGVELVDEVADGSAEPVKSPDDEGVAGADLVEELVELGSVFEGPGHGVDEHAEAAGRVECVDLQRGVLVGGRHARVSKEVTHEENVAKPDQQG